jgi:hypothetical protein
MDGIATAVPFAGDRGRGTDERIKARLIKRLELGKELIASHSHTIRGRCRNL